MNQELQITEKHISPIQAKVNDLAIVGSESLVIATEYLSQINKYLDVLTEEKEKLTKPLNATLKEIRARYKPSEEALEALRHGNPPSDHIPDFSGVEEELADTIIRIMDYGLARGHRVALAVEAKIAFNRTRPHKHGGKKF